MNSEECMGKYLLVGITFLDEEENVIEQYQTHGKIVSVDDQRGITIEKADGTGRYTIPPDVSNLHTAVPGEYRIVTTGDVVVDPDFTSTWTVYETEGNTSEDYKKSGFGDFS